MNWIEYYFGHCFQTGWREMWNNFKMWRDLISGNYENYNILPLLGTNTEKTKLSWLEYIWFSCITQGWANFYYAYKNWVDLMGNNYQGYALLPEDDPLELCILYFWDSLEDEIYPKFFLEELLQMADDIDSGKEKVYPMDEVFDRLKEKYEEDDEDT